MFGEGEPVGYAPVAGPGGSGAGGSAPAESDVRAGVVYDVGSLPAQSDVRFGVVYG